MKPGIIQKRILERGKNFQFTGLDDHDAVQIVNISETYLTSMECMQGKDWKCLLHTAIQRMAVLPSALYSMDMDIGQCTHVFHEGHFEAELNVRGIVLVIRNSLTGAVETWDVFDIHVGRSHFGLCRSFSNHKFLNHKLALRLLQPWGMFTPILKSLFLCLFETDPVQ